MFYIWYCHEVMFIWFSHGATPWTTRDSLVFVNVTLVSDEIVTDRELHYIFTRPCITPSHEQCSLVSLYIPAGPYRSVGFPNLGRLLELFFWTRRLSTSCHNLPINHPPQKKNLLKAFSSSRIFRDARSNSLPCHASSRILHERTQAIQGRCFGRWR